MEDTKIKSQAVLNAGKRYGGNRKAQTFRNCKKCKTLFGPLKHLTRLYCSKTCMYSSRIRKKKTVSLKIAINAQRILKYHVDKGYIKRPGFCENCGEYKKIEAAHKDYAYPLDVRWLCRSCHVRWDKDSPKRGTKSVTLNYG